ncbi:MAG: SelT/SelW/SelH family protein [Candidatus Eisenbacteria bacterium]|uniref:SelT/SelW/SelH family protein n=1 Tax=Eiseniibacteriota bacterium TaxID=2212470 RepID=A0A538UCK0_UNCEI|nr:MAG: SelT/SelW/SelH family protein [Candidatus Eisenbacteria bacterium]
MPRATSLAAEIKKARGLDATFIKGSGGQLEIVLDGQLIFSKKQAGRWPELNEVLEKIPAAS